MPAPTGIEDEREAFALLTVLKFAVLMSITVHRRPPKMNYVSKIPRASIVVRLCLPSWMSAWLSREGVDY
jgi:hypothetical protein